MPYTRRSVDKPGLFLLLLPKTAQYVVRFKVLVGTYSWTVQYLASFVSSFAYGFCQRRLRASRHSRTPWLLAGPHIDDLSGYPTCKSRA